MYHLHHACVYSSDHSYHSHPLTKHAAHRRNTDQPLRRVLEHVPRQVQFHELRLGPIIPRPEAHDLPKRLKTMANKAGKGWLHATLTVKSSKLLTGADGEVIRPGLPASGMFLINPPHTLKAQLKDALPQMAELLKQDQHASSALEHSN